MRILIHKKISVIDDKKEVHMKILRKYVGLIVLIVSAIASVIIDIVMESNSDIFNEINRILFSMVTVIAGFWVTTYLLFLQIYKDRYPMKFIKDKYLQQMKYNITYIIYSIIFGCVIIIKDGGVVENWTYATTSLFTTFIVIKSVYDASKTMMVNTYVDEFCDGLSNKLKNKENSVKKDIFNDLRYIIDECIVKEEYFVVQNISEKTGTVFRDFLKNSIILVENADDKKEIEDAYERIINISLYQLKLCKDVNSELLISNITELQVKNIKFCIKTEQFEWFKKYIKEMSILSFHAQKDCDDKIVDASFSVYYDVIELLVEEEKDEWIKYLIEKLYGVTTSLNFLNKNNNLKHYVALLVYGLLGCKENNIYDYLYKELQKFTNIVSSVSNGFANIKVYYALYFNHLKGKKNEKEIEQFFDMIFDHSRDNSNDNSWTEFKFYCLKEMYREKYDIDINSYHIKLLVEVIEMKEKYCGYIGLPQFEKILEESQYSSLKIKKVCDDLRFLLNKCIINDNLNLYFVMLHCVSECLVNTEARQKELQVSLLDLLVWLVERTKRLNNKQYVEIVFMELEDSINELDKKRAISNDFGDKIIRELTDLARTTDLASYNVVIQVIELLSAFLKENEELSFISTSMERKKMLYKGMYNIAISCVENDFEEGVRRCSNAIGWFTVYSIKQGNSKLTNYLIQLASNMLEIAIELQVSMKTQAFLMTLFTTIGTYCCKDSYNYVYIDLILKAIQQVDKNIVYTAIRIRTYENDMWDELFDKKTKQLTTSFRKKYDDYKQKK